MKIVKSLAAAAVLAALAIGPALADCSYSKQDTLAAAPKPAEVAVAPTVVTPAPDAATPAATTTTPSTEVASASQEPPAAVKPN